LARGADEAGVARVVPEGTPRARRAITRVRARPGDAAGGLTLLALEPETGRTHQLRAQAASRGLPIVGDAAYGSARPFARGIALHARSLRFEHPASRLGLAVACPPPADWGEILAR
jgi:23S rRNA pseudouridine1911/1915/1917 synthase